MECFLNFVFYMYRYLLSVLQSYCSYFVIIVQNIVVVSGSCYENTHDVKLELRVHGYRRTIPKSSMDTNSQLSLSLSLLYIF